MNVRVLFLAFLVALLNTVNAQQNFKVGEIIDHVPVNDSAETFSLYLPSQYDANKLSAIVFIFDPSGNGHGGVSVFKDAAEQFNYILVCSNATRNGIPYETNFASINALSKTIFSTFKIDEQQIYAAGFSGGARLASSVAALTNKFQAVIACGAGMAVNSSYDPQENSFSFLGLVGNRDMNYQEMLRTKASLDTLNVPNELLIYEDTHSWPPKVQIQRAFEWLEVKAYQKNIRTRNQSYINVLYRKQYRLADSLSKERKHIRTLHELKHLQSSFQHFINTDSIQNKITKLESSSAYQKAKSHELEMRQLEKNLSGKLLSQFQRDVLMGKSDDSFAWWKKEFRKLNDMILRNDIMAEKRVYERVKSFLGGGFYESSASYVYSKDYKRALYCDQLLVLLNADNPYVYYRLAISYARNKDFSNTFKNLKKAKELNLKDFESTRNTPEFTEYQNRRKFLKLYN